MPVINRVASLSGEIAGWRRDLHQHPELLFDLPRTTEFVAGKLREFGCDEIATGVGRSGIVAVIEGRRGEGRNVGLRADMDALPIMEATGAAHASRTAGKMHACGHDGHTSMLLGAAKYLAETRNFAGRAILIFQPAEEGGDGARAMLADGVMDRYGVHEVYAMHNYPGLPVGRFALRSGSLMAGSNIMTIRVSGKGGHAASPHSCTDTVLIGSQIVTALQTVISRNLDPVEAGVVSVATFRAGDKFNILPETALLTGTCRAMTPEVLGQIEARATEIVTGTARMLGGDATVSFERDSPATINSPAQYEHAAATAEEIAGAGHVERNCRPVMIAEDFGDMLAARPGAFIFMGNGDSAGLHHPKYDFDDAAIPFGVSWLARLVERQSPA
jgi:hippurate hydrolase